MRFVIQRVSEASVTVEQEVLGQIGLGFMVLIGIENEDTKETADKMIKKMCGLRIFADGEGKTNLSIDQVGGSLLLISQFTLYADCKHGNRPSFTKSGNPQMASDLYDYICVASKSYVPNVQKGSFGADMKVALVNDGPFTILLDSKELNY